MNTVSFQAPEDMCERLEKCALELDRSKAYIIRKALEEHIQDLEDMIEARRIQSSYTKDDLIDFEDIKKEFNFSE